MDSSPDLSLKLRRGSSDSRDSFYMDFAQGIDSDIEEVPTTASGPLPGGIDGTTGEEDEDDDDKTRAAGTTSGGGFTTDGGGPESPTLPLPPPPPLPFDEEDENLDVMEENLKKKTSASPSTPNIVLADTLSHHSSSPAKTSQVISLATVQQQQHQHQQQQQRYQQPSPSLHSYSGGTITTAHHVTIEESSDYHRRLPLSLSSHQQLSLTKPSTPSPSTALVRHHPSPLSVLSPPSISPTATTATHQHLAVLYHSHHHHLHPAMTSRRSSRLPEPKFIPTRPIRARDALATTLSALYGKLLVVMGIAFPMAEVISTYIPPSFYEGFYLYLYIGSMVFLLFMYITLLWGRPKTSTVASGRQKPVVQHKSSCSSDSGEESDRESETSSGCRRDALSTRRPSILAASSHARHHFGSFYLRMGAVAFGIGSMIYSGLEFGQYFELERDTKCHNVLLALTPATRMAFIFIQMYFIFLNNEQIKVYRHKIIARFGLMHMIGTNLSVWLNVLIQETKHEILTFYSPENGTLRISHRLGNKLHNLDTTAHLRVARGLKGPHHIYECRRTNIIGTLVQDASPFLFPCTIEYSLICAAILYVMWRNISRPHVPPVIRQEGHTPCKRSPHHYSVDCARAHKGLFIGILILVLTIISLILFFVLISRPEFVNLAVTEVTICELTLYAAATVATLIGMVQVRHLQYDAERSFELDDILLVGAQTGSFLYSTFTVIGGHFTMQRDTVIVLVNALASIVQTACQTMFILDSSRRNAATPEHIRKKPGREIVTFLLVANLAMWAISTLEKSRAESHPIQLHFYGLWAWTIITHVSMPLAIFYRFHSTVCLCEIWKRAYKMKPAYM